MWTSIPVPRVGSFSYVPRYDLRPGIPDMSLFPYTTWRRLTTQSLRASSMGTGMLSDPAGPPTLRAALSRYIDVSRDVHASAEHIVVTQGIQQALDLVGRVLLRPGDCVAVEDPGYPKVRDLFRAIGAEVVGVPVDSEGLRVDRLPDDARIVYVTPSHQFPLGIPMSLARRVELLEWARNRDAVVIEDDYDTDFRYSGGVLKPLHSLDPAGRVVYIGTFSTTLLPVLRLGFMAAPGSLSTALRTAKFIVDRHSPEPGQAALAGFIEEGLLAKHIRRMRSEYRARHDRIVTLLESDFVDTMAIIPSAVGLHVAAWTAPNIDASAVAIRARQLGIHVLPLSQFRMSDGPDGLILGYGALPLSDVDKALTLLQTAIESAGHRGATAVHHPA
ncbi:PLP-dependent aminotransferase family protein [Nocardia sp. NPDC049190]|uniref:MocR-like pyridoxine biosynthesis transcription factor PdxR n=1 Tax=Nocardia sp. NPDC049190 TaxID=3155650 RepID=UPI00340236F4